VRGQKFRLPSPEVLGRLAPNDYGVEACWLPDETGAVPEVYLYQGGSFIARCTPVEAYNEATAEQTDEDRRNYTEQAKYVSEFDALMKREQIRKVRILPRGLPSGEAETVGVPAGDQPGDQPGTQSYGQPGTKSGQPGEPPAHSTPGAAASDAGSSDDFGFGADYAALARQDL